MGYDIGSTLLSCLPTSSIQVSSEGVAALGADGYVVASTPVVSTFDALVQPLPAEKAQHIEEAARRMGAIEIFTKTKIDVNDPTSGESQDEVTWNGREYVLQSEENWLATFGFYRYTATLKGEG